ncbi:thioesterase II family protein [Phytohabitans suffuscus]|uniref:Oleoyl-ACP hydrolase n=1 Tax=Phytohabitans suffuscus TaxID=624315 RepID=A0A6F8Y9D9_9ACTN|nr:alpha/beta fold hydrolase [Phytohabitans suffuscus]BCB82715.1 oleoyl-ACP hydrolase [Phytohabitans suffuscus]
MTSVTADRDAWIRQYHPAPGSDVRLVCFPHAGGSASFFFPVSERLAPGVELLAVQYPGRQDRRTEPNIDSIHRLADRIAEVLLPLAGEGKRLAFFGHSMGATVAYEVALRLEEAGAPPLTLLFASGRRSPSSYRPESVHLRDDRGIVTELQLLGGTEARLVNDPEVLAMALPALRADYRAIETYSHVPERSLRCPVLVLIGDSDPRVTLDEAKRWAGHSTGPWELRVFPGGHFYLVPRSAEVIAVIAEKLGR